MQSLICLSYPLKPIRDIDCRFHCPAHKQIMTDQRLCLYMREGRRRSGIVCSAQYGDKDELRNQKKALEALLRLSKEADEATAGESEQAVQPIIKDLPLWRIQSATLPCAQNIYHIHVPHYVSMFGELLDGPKPHRFGHIYLPGGSMNLGNPTFELRPGTSAPLIGTLMEVVSHLWLEDGRLLILAVGLCRIKVVSQRQAVPHSRADVEMLPDLEDVQDKMQLAMRAVDACPAGSDADMVLVMQSAHAAATAAASASTLAWVNYEVASLRKLSRAPQEASPGAAQMFNKSKLVWRHILASLNGLKSGLKLGVSIGQDEIADLGHLKDKGSAERRECMAQLAEVSREAEGAAARAASAAAALALGQTGPSSAELAESGQLPMNTVSGRGVPCEGLSTASGDSGEDAPDSCLSAMPQACSDALTAERRVWRLHSEISELALLTHRLLSCPEVLLPEVVMQLDPRSSNSGSSSSGTISRSDTPLPASLAGPISAPEEDLQAGTAAEGENPEQSVSPEHASAAEEGQLYPAIRRASRLSFCMATALPGSFDGAEGRQAVLEATGIAARLNLLIEILQKRKDELAVLHALEQGYSNGGQQEGSA